MYSRIYPYQNSASVIVLWAYCVQVRIQVQIIKLEQEISTARLYMHRYMQIGI